MNESIDCIYETTRRTVLSFCYMSLCRSLGLATTSSSRATSSFIR